jgi:CheY-like chemotaxis protein
MPVMDGIEATSIIRKISFRQYVPVIAVTACVMETEINSILQAGLDDILAKPVKKDALKNTIYKWTKKMN